MSEIDTIAGLAHKLRDRTMSSVDAVTHYLGRIDNLDQRVTDGRAINAIIERNPDAMKIARALDREARNGLWRGPLHGVPIVVKDNIDTGDRMHTTAGSIAMAKVRAQTDAFVIQQLRDAGAVILAKSNLSEWANFRGSRSMSGWSSLGGQTRNPHDLARSPSGSSSGSGAAVAAGLCVAAVGTETDGSITSPASVNGIVGFKPTVGLVSRRGIIPISHTQDTAGPMTVTVEDAALVVSAMQDRDPKDRAMRATQVRKPPVTGFGELDPNALKGCRLGVARSTFGTHSATLTLFDQALGVMRSLGATIIDDVDLGKIRDIQSSEIEVLWFELKADLNAYLRTAGGGAPKNLAELIRFNQVHHSRVLAYFGQEHFEKAQSCGSLRTSRYLEAFARCDRLGRVAIERAMRRHRLDALVAPTAEPAWLTDDVNGDASNDNFLTTTVAAVPGFPHLSVPMGFVRHLPVGLSFIGRAWSDRLILDLGFAYEQHTHHLRKPPAYS